MLGREGHIFLIGFMGVGKTTAAVRLGERFSMEVMEMDQEIERREKRCVSEIFEAEGETYFRDRETELLRELKDRAPVIVSCGGGVPLRPVNVTLMKSCGTVIFLTAAPETILARVGNSHDRPLLEHNKNVKFIAELMEKRRAGYEAAADYVLDTDGKSAEGICGEIAARLSL